MRRIAILDTGVGASEDDFVKLHVKKSFDFTTPKFSESNIGLDDNGHGTTCAKIILKNAAKSEIYSLKVLDKNRCFTIHIIRRLTILQNLQNHQNRQNRYKQGTAQI